jgi:uncharacterized NAD(P)/FAD-binding protein YdhS
LSPQRTIAIVGAGFSGTLVAVNLLKAQHWATTQILLIERAKGVARGKAYADRDHPYLLNVPAGRMSADPHSPEDFLHFAQHRIPAATAEDFLPRSMYGQYLEATLLAAEVSAPPQVRFERLRGEVCTVEKIDDGSSFNLQLSDGRCLIADDVVLALGNPPPAALPGTEKLTRGVGHAPSYIPDPWAAQLKFRPSESVLLIGAGLTMVDVATAAAAATNEQVVVHAISRHGMVPTSQAPFVHNACKGDGAALLRAASFSARALFRNVRELAAQTERRGGDWREAVTFVRNMAPALWQRLPLRERRRMLRHIRPYWDVHRHRLPNETLAKLSQLRQSEKLHVHAGRLLSFAPVGNQVRVTWRPRGAHNTQSMVVDRVINCTGPDYNARRSRDPLLRSLISQGLATPDALGLGIRTGAYGALLDAKGRSAANLFYVGPMLRADHWEATGASELRVHAERLSGYLTAPVGRQRAPHGTQISRAASAGRVSIAGA